MTTTTIEGRAPASRVVEPAPLEPRPREHRVWARRRVPAALIGFVALGTVLRIWGLGAHRLGYDESFTAMADRLPLGDLFAHLRVDDSHPPLDYLLRLPLARAGVSELWFRFPSFVCSAAALALFAWWMRRRGVAGVIATGLLAINAFQLTHGRTARMYAELELVGVAAAVLAEAWLRSPRRWHPPALGTLVLVGLLLHVQMFLLAGGLLALAGLRRDRAAWLWRAAIAAGGLGWAVLWGPSFLVQSRGGHSDWIPRTTPYGILHTFGRLVTFDSRYQGVVLVAAIAGAIVVGRRDRHLARVLVCCSFVPIALAAALGTVYPVLLDRALTVTSWGPLLAIGFLVAELGRRSRVVGAIAVVTIAVIALPAGVSAVDAPPSPDRALDHLAAVGQPGDVVAIHPGGMIPELEWSLGFQGKYPYRVVPVNGLDNTSGILLGRGRPTGRTWVLDVSRWHRLSTSGAVPCAPEWSWGASRVLCVR